MTGWYLSYDGGQEGPMDEMEARARAQANPEGFAWRQGFFNWTPIAQVPELMQSGLAGPGAAPTPPPPSAMQAHDIDYRILGQEMQFVEVELDPGESAVAEAGAMMYKDPEVAMETIFGDGSARHASSGFMGKLMGAGKRMLTGESLFMTVFTQTGGAKGHVAFAAPYPGNIIPVLLTDLNGYLVCQKDCFLCAAKGVSMGIEFQKRILTGLFGGEGFIMQKLEGDGLVFVHAGGTVMERTLGPGEEVHVDTGCVVAFESRVDFDIRQVGGIKTSLFGGEGLFLAQLRGPGKIWLQSLPFSRVAGRMLQAAPQGGGRRQGEGSILGTLGDLLDGDN
ncbi:TIGR00266 family protein [Oceanidesulfovibrio marinus]|uniref:TIGR00266 family protein n=1 Tax=Oceanidesulfovibrio marinus TaxID=370038 RepID=A0A6P1ZA53_9BACT|nr:TIGR00266 family protein [Oceanidesulfovibrio marinus]TVM30373.1 TIGR00266 family protein [Oceanidesulfovibrio marinus]